MTRVTKRLLWLLPVFASLALSCRDATGPTAPVADRYALTSFTYAYREPGYSEGLDSLAGRFLVALGRVPDASFTWGSDQDVIAYIWTKDDTLADTGRVVGRVWPAALTLTGTRVPPDADAFTLADIAPTGTWVTGAGYGFTRLGTDSLIYWRALADSTLGFSFLIEARFTRVPS